MTFELLCFAGEHHVRSYLESRSPYVSGKKTNVHNGEIDSDNRQGNCRVYFLPLKLLIISILCCNNLVDFNSQTSE